MKKIQKKNLQKIEIPENLDRFKVATPDMNYPYFDHGGKVFLKYRKNDFNLQNAWFLSESSMLIFNPYSFIKYVFYHAGFDEVRAFTGKNIARCFAASNKNAAVIVFRGTELNSLKLIPGVVADFNFAFTDNRPGGRVHTGFKKVLDEIWEGRGMLRQYLESLKDKNPSIRIFITGHSLGGALALIAASRFPDADCVYTYGCPRTGNREFGETIKPPVYRVVNNNDAITMLPPKRIVEQIEGEEYAHTGELRFISKEGRIYRRIPNKITLGTKKEKEKLFSSGIDKVITQLTEKLQVDFVDHVPFFYASKLWNAYVDSLLSREASL